ncbi:MAG TPA: iron chelate uptake ABC transporter family permease subunit, partial [Rubricoccaceae bacterium]|nr:iron chelate uptake ABC transporter family permease subunit [Rubricoccaceae bacterium]
PGGRAHRGRAYGGRAYGHRAPWALSGLAAALVGVALLSLGVGSVAITPGEVAAIVRAQLGLGPAEGYTMQQAVVLLYVRLPRVLLGLLVGAALGVSGAVMQGLFRNPLAEPGLVGVSAGSALTAVGFIVLGGGLALPPLVQATALPLAAFAGGLAATWLVYRLATRGGRTAVATLLLAGVALGALAGAGTGLLLFLADDARLRTVTFWSLGSLGGATWTALAGAAPPLLLALAGAAGLARPLNALLLGEAEAFHLGVRVERAKRLAVGAAALGVGAAVAVSGVIGFVGLVVPHLGRLALGPDHRRLLPASALLGASLLLLADLAARTVAAPAELPIGVLTALVGAPFFLWLLLRERPS